MLTRPDSSRRALAGESETPRAAGLIVARIGPDHSALASATIVDELDHATIDRIRRTALTLRARYATPITIELRYVAAPETDALVAHLDELRARDIHVVRAAASTVPSFDVGASALRVANGEPLDTVSAAETAAMPARNDVDGATDPADGSVASVGTFEPAAPAPADERPRRTIAPAPPSPDPFGVDLEYRRGWLPLLRFFYETYWRVEVSGIENVPADGAALVAANHSGAVPADAFMTAVALELHHPRRRALRVLYDKFVDALPWIGPLYNRLGGVPSSFANAELLLRRREVLAIFPEGIAGIEKRWIDRYQLRPFKSGTARLSLATGSPIVPVAIVGAEEAYPVMARLYRAGRLVGVPWIPVTPLFPLCGIAGALPLPSKWRIRFCPPIMPPAAAPDDEDAVANLTAAVRRSIAVALGDLLLTRRGVFV